MTKQTRIKPMVAILLTLAMLISILPMGAMAATTRTATVTPATGTITAGDATSQFTFTVNTRNIPNGTYTMGFAPGQHPNNVQLLGTTISIHNNVGTFTVRSTANATAQTFNNVVLQILVSGSVVNTTPFTLVVAPAAQPAATVTPATGTIMAGDATSQFTFTVNTQNIPNGTYTMGFAPGQHPNNVQLLGTTITIHNNVGTFTVRSTANATAQTFSNLVLQLLVSGNVVNTIPFTLVVEPAQTGTFAITVTPNESLAFNLIQGYAAVAPRTVTVTNTGTLPTGALTVSLILPDADGIIQDAFIINPPVIPSIPVGQSATFIMAPRLGLPITAFGGLIEVSNANVSAPSPRQAFILTVSPASAQPTATVTPTTGIITAGDATSQFTFTVNTQNIPNGTYTMGFAPGQHPNNVQLLGTTITIHNNVGTFTVQSTAHATAQTFDNLVLQLLVNGNVVNTTPFTLVIQPPTSHWGISLTPATNHTFPAATVGYTTAPPARTTTVGNTGNQPTGVLTVSLSGANPNAFTLNVNSLASIPAGSITRSFTVRPVTGLAAGTYTATVTVFNTANGILESFDVSFTVNPAPQQPRITLSAYSLNFGIIESNVPATPVTVTVTNTGNVPTGALAISFSPANNYMLPDAFEFSTTTLASIPVGQSRTFTVAPRLGLPPATVQGGSVVVSNANVRASLVTTVLIAAEPQGKIHALTVGGYAGVIDQNSKTITFTIPENLLGADNISGRFVGNINRLDADSNEVIFHVFGREYIRTQGMHAGFSSGDTVFVRGGHVYTIHIIPTPVTRTVTFRAGANGIFTGNVGGAGAAVRTITLPYGTVLDESHLPAVQPNTGWRHSGWQPANPVGQAVTTNMEFVATYEIVAVAGFTITYDGNNHTGGTVPVDDAQYQAGARVTPPLSDLTRDGHILRGWIMDAPHVDQGGTVLPGNAFTVVANHTLFARWFLSASQVGAASRSVSTIDINMEADIHARIEVFVERPMTIPFFGTTWVPVQSIGHYGMLAFDPTPQPTALAPTRGVFTISLPADQIEAGFRVRVVSVDPAGGFVQPEIIIGL